MSSGTIEKEINDIYGPVAPVKIKAKIEPSKAKVRFKNK